jgi:periodic tryptophan protein 1
MDTAMITATAWVPRGFAAQFPVRKELNDEEFERIAAMSKLKLEDAQDDLEDAEAEARIDEKDDADAGPSDDEDGETMEEDTDEVEAAKAASAAAAPSTESKKEKDDDDLAEYNLDTYDDEGVDETGEQMGMFANIKSLAYHQPGEEDPYITLKDVS